MINREDAALKLARAIVADVKLYNQDAIEKGSQQVWEAIFEGRALYTSRVSHELMGLFDTVLEQDPILRFYAGGQPHGPV